MEKAQLIVRKTKKNKIVAELLFIETQRKMPFPQWPHPDISMNEKDVDVERDKGKIQSVRVGDKVLYQTSVAEQVPGKFKKDHPKTYKGSAIESRSPEKPLQTVHSKELMQMDQISPIRFPAHAPYNFVPLNKTIVEVDREEILPFNSYYQNRHTGWIEIEIETLTPLFIRGTLTREQSVSGKANKDTSDFFSPGGKIRIPGSSLRGMVRNLVEIMSFGKFENFDDRRLYFRGLADKSNLRREYQQNMSSYDMRSRKTLYRVSAGILRKNGMQYEIISSGSNFRQIFKKDAEKEVVLIGRKYAEFNFYELKNEYLVVSGDMKNKKRDWLIGFPPKNTLVLPIPDEDVTNYHNDSTRSDKVPNLIKMAAKGNTPCFYVMWHDRLGNERISFGHTAMFRLAYRLSIGEHIPMEGFKIDEITINCLRESKLSPDVLEAVKSLMGKRYSKKELNDILVKLNFKKEIEKIMACSAIIDIPEAIFGKQKTFAGRVFFEDAFLNEGQNDVMMGKATPKILASPKPTTFQHYLVQDSDSNRQLNHYNSFASIRGYKLYWHKSGKSWEETDRNAIKEHATQYTQINPVKPGINFTGRIRFENLSEVELGALLSALDLPGGCCHKLGMGKPLGMGSVKITLKLFLSDRKERYQDILSDLSISESKQIPAIKRNYETHILEKIGEKDMNSLWEVGRLRELKTMLDFETGLKLENKNIYMNITPENEFKNRPVLPLPRNV